MPIEVLAEIFNSESKAFQKVAEEKHNCIVPLNTVEHWVVLFFLGNIKKIPLIRLEILLVKEYLILSINVSFAGKHITVKLQYDSYQCGVWCSFFVDVCVCVCVCVLNT